MKYDTCGGAAVFGAMHAIAHAKLPLHVVALFPAAENMVSSNAYRPDDIITMYNGTTVEVTNTDAEGRLVLADAISYGCEKYKPTTMIELSTLTGGVVTALGCRNRTSQTRGPRANHSNLQRLLRCRCRELSFMTRLRVHQTRRNPIGKNMIQARLIATNAGINFIGTPSCCFNHKIWIGQEGARKRNHICLTALKNLFSNCGHIDTI
jgi:hypothetical protein